MNIELPILLVDDLAAMRRVVRSLLQQIGYDCVSEAADGLSALALLRTGGFQLLILDWNMPGLSGIELLNAIREEPGMATLPILMLTVEARRDQIAAAKAAGVSGGLIKPFSAESLRTALEALKT